MEVKLPDVCQIQYGFAFDSAQFSTTTGIPLIRIRDVVRGYSETYTTEECSEEYLVNDGDLLIGMDGEFNIARWQGGRALLNQRVCRLFPSEKIDPGYLFYFMPQALKEIEEQTPFVTVKHLSAKQLNSISILLPELGEQQHVATVLDKISGLISLRKQQLAKLDELVKVRFVEMFGDPATDQHLWEKSTLGGCCIIKSGTSLPAEVENEGGTIPYVKVGDMNLLANEYYITTSSRFVTPKTAGRGIFPVGTIIFPKRGGAIGTNKKRLTQLPICADLNVMGITPGPKVLPEYLLTYFKFLDLDMLDNGSSVPQINHKDIAPLIIGLPPLELQKHFSTITYQIIQQKLTIQQSLDKLEVLKKALMQEYFG